MKKNDISKAMIDVVSPILEYVADKLILNTSTQELGNKVKQLMQFDKSKITKYVTAVDKTQGEINFLKLDSY